MTTERDDHVLILCMRMLSRRPVWVNSPARQETTISMIEMDHGEVIVYDEDGNDRPWYAYLLGAPERPQNQNAPRALSPLTKWH